MSNYRALVKYNKMKEIAGAKNLRVPKGTLGKVNMILTDMITKACEKAEKAGSTTLKEEHFEEE